MRSFVVLGCVAASLVACSSPDPGVSLRHGSSASPDPTTSNPPLNDLNPPADPGSPPAHVTTVGDETWADGKQITEDTAVAAGKTVVIAPGATITVAAGKTITIQGTLKADANAAHAKITGSGGSWGGLVVASGGTLSADSLDLSGASKALWTQKGNADATFANGTITADTPFTMEAGSKLTLTKVSATATAASALAGTFTASYLTYDKGTAEGLYVNDAQASVTITDSTLKGSGGGDYVVSSGAHLVKLSYTTISGSHCPQHFTAVDQFVIDHVSNNANNYGPMLYGSGAGPNTITASNLQDLTYDYDVQNTNGKITITGSYAPGSVNISTANQTAKTVTVTSPSGAAIADAKPR
jgi:hypothetical protein